MKRITIIALTLLGLCGRVSSQEQVADPRISISDNIIRLSKTNETMDCQLFQLHADATVLGRQQDSLVTRAAYYNLNKTQLQKICSSKPLLIRLHIARADGKFFDLTLARYNIFTHNFQAGSTNGSEYTAAFFHPGVYYRGTIDGHKGWASFSLTNNEVQGLIANEEGNWVLGALKGTATYIFYNDVDLKKKNAFQCGINGSETGTPADRLSAEGSNGKPTQICPIRVFWVADYDFFAVSNYNLQTALFNISGIFNNVATLYQNEGIPVILSETYVHTTPDGYPKTDLGTPFNMFGFNIHNATNFDESLAMLLAVGGVGQSGGVGVIDALCAPAYNPNLQFSGGRYAYSKIEPFYYNIPTFSNTIGVVTHEMGHNVGSRHTHWCGWPGGAIDNCVVTPEPGPLGNNCPAGPYPANGGTIMSYCALMFGSIPFVNGFGYYPNMEIIKDVNAASVCLCTPNSVEPPPAMQHTFEIYPNPAASVLEIKYSGPKEDISTVTLYNSYSQQVLQTSGLALIDITHLAPGLYFVVAEINDQKTVSKLLKQ